MTKRRLDTHEECLRSFSLALQKEIKENLAFWSKNDPAAAESRAGAYALVVSTFKDQLTQHEIPLVDVGLVDYEIPRINR